MAPPMLHSRVVLVAVGALFLAALFVMPSLNVGGAEPSGADDVLLGGGGANLTVPVTFQVNNTTHPNYLSGEFWGTTVTSRAALIANEGPLVNSTPTQVVVWPGGSAGDDYDPLPGANNQTFHAQGSGISNNATTTEAQFVTWCRAINCSAILQVPGEIDDPAIAAEIVNYTENTLHFKPIEWFIGNEPEEWYLWGDPWSQWATDLARGTYSYVDPSQYAWEVYNYSAAMRKVDPKLSILGLSGTGAANGITTHSAWVQDTIDVNGKNISGVAFHEYPAEGQVGSNLVTFYSTLQSSTGLLQRTENMRYNVNRTVAACVAKGYTWCGTTASIPVIVTEIGSALSHTSYGPFSVGFPGALSLAAQISDAMALNITNVDLFSAVFGTTNSWFNLTGSPRPDYSLYSDVLARLGPVAFPTNLLPPSSNSTDQHAYYGLDKTKLSSNLYAVETTDPANDHRADLMAVNLNLSYNVSFKPVLEGVGAGNSTEVVEWSGVRASSSWNATELPATTAPTIRYFTLTPNGTFTLPPQTVVLFQSYPSPTGAAGGTAVVFNESGVPQGKPLGGRWFLTVDGHTETSNGTGNLTFYLAPGLHTVHGPALSIAYDNTTMVRVLNDERLYPFPASPVDATGTSVTLPAPFLKQWAINISENPNGTGRVSPDPKWGNATEPISLNASATGGFLFDRWTGSGPGSSNSTNSTTVIWANGSILEKAHFIRGYNVEMRETGLPAGVPWYVTVRGAIFGSSTNSTNLTEGNGTFGFSVGTVAGYGSVPTNSSFTVIGAPSVVLIDFIALTPPPPRYPVSLIESGLPVGTNWTVTVRGIPLTSSTNTTNVSEPDGIYGYSVTPVPGFRSQPTNSSFDVQGMPLDVSVQFLRLTPPPTPYSVTINETGLPSGTPWSITIRGTLFGTNDTRLNITEPNGTFGFSVGPIPGFRTEPTNSTFTVAGAPLRVQISFIRLTPPPPRYEVTFNETGLPTGTAWSVVVRNVTLNGSTSEIQLTEPNGTYGFQVGAVPGFHPLASGSPFHVAGGPVSVTIEFLPNAPPPVQFPVVLEESGLPTGTSWTVIVRGTSFTQSTNSTILLEKNGTFGFVVVQVPGFASRPVNSSFTVAGDGTVVSVQFYPGTAPPPPSEYTVLFEEVGLPAGTNWSIEVRGVAGYSTTTNLTFEEINGTFGYHAIPLEGFRAHPPGSSFDVLGAPLDLVVQFSPFRYTVDWEETNLGANLSWSVNVTGADQLANGSWTSEMLPNGSYHFVIPRVQDFVAEPHVGTVVVGGSSVVVPIVFVRAKFLVEFHATIDGQPTVWQVRLSDVRLNATAPSVGFDEPNGTYSYDVLPPTGMHATPSHGVIAVQAAPVTVEISLASNGPGPLPALWNLARPAVTAVAIMGLAGWGAFALVRAVRRRK
ncbi:MAG: hypothetical protein L3K03_04880 [Thermoplasmata archaeon]|nr:hypothetical protein [Thermoplasmata archaeon]